MMLKFRGFLGSALVSGIAAKREIRRALVVALVFGVMLVGGAPQPAVAQIAKKAAPTKERPAKSSAAPKTPLEFKGLRLGATFEQVSATKDLYLSSCVDKQDQAGAKSCVLNVEYAVELKSPLITFVDEKFSGVVGRFDTDNYTKLVEALSVKFGPPDKTDTQSYQNGFGAKFVGRMVLWDRDGTMLHVAEYSNNRDTGFFVFTPSESDDSARKERTAKEAAKKL